MTESEAIQRAKRFLFSDRGVDAEPQEIHLLQRPGERRHWWMNFGTTIYFPDETAAGSTIDDGYYILAVDDESGEVERLE